MSAFKTTQFWERYCSGNPEARSKYASIVVPIVSKAAYKAGCRELDSEVLECTVAKTQRYFCPVRIDLSDNPEGYIALIARSCAENTRKRIPKAKSTDPHSIDVEGLDRDAPDFASVARDKKKEDDLRVSSLADCLNSLSVNHRDAVETVMRFLVDRGLSLFQDRLPWSEMANEIGWPVQTLKDRFWAGMDILRRRMSNQHSDEPIRFQS